MHYVDMSDVTYMQYVDIWVTSHICSMWIWGVTSHICIVWIWGVTSHIRIMWMYEGWRHICIMWIWGVTSHICIVWIWGVTSHMQYVDMSDVTYMHFVDIWGVTSHIRIMWMYESDVTYMHYVDMSDVTYTYYVDIWGVTPHICIMWIWVTSHICIMWKYEEWRHIYALCGYMRSDFTYMHCVDIWGVTITYRQYMDIWSDVTAPLGFFTIVFFLETLCYVIPSIWWHRLSWNQSAVSSSGMCCRECGTQGQILRWW
jgi:hypothetical protein